MFVQYRPIALGSSCLESDQGTQKVNKQLLAESDTCHGLKRVLMNENIILYNNRIVKLRGTSGSVLK